MLKFNFEFNGKTTEVEMEKPALGEKTTSKIIKETGKKIEQVQFDVENKDNHLLLSVHIKTGKLSGERGTKKIMNDVLMPIVDYDCGLDIQRVVYGTVPIEAPADRVIE